MAQSALRGLVSGLMQGGPAPAGMANYQTAIQNAAQRPQPKPMGQQVADVLGGVSLPLSAVPVVGDVTGLAADAAMYANYPEERTALNYGMTLAGMLPFVPSAAGIRSAQGAAEGALDMSQAARMQRAQDMGFDTSTAWYHGTNADFDEFKPSSGRVGKGIYLTKSPEAASAHSVKRLRKGKFGRFVESSPEGANVIPVFIREGSGNMYTGQDTIVLNPANIRSVNAAFDPAKRKSANLMAGVMGGAVGLSALRQLMPQQEQE